MDQNTVEERLKVLIVEALKLEDVTPEEIGVEDALVGEGLGLDSIDILELAMAVHKEFGVRTEQDEDRNQQIFASVRSLAAFIAESLEGQ